jgi:selenide,water dikinase
MGLVPEGTWRNREGRQRFLLDAGDLSPVLLDLLFDPQTSGGLLAALPADQAPLALAALAAAGVEAWRVGETTDRPGTVQVRP